jgi:hypothetical protein
MSYDSGDWLVGEDREQIPRIFPASADHVAVSFRSEAF